MRIQGSVISVSRSSNHNFSKNVEDSIVLLQDLGVEGDAHLGKTVQHISRVRQNPEQPNLRQVHLIHSELFAELEIKGFKVLPGEMGENITTSGLDLLGLPTGTRLKIGREAVVEITGLRNPCKQIDDFQNGLMNAVLERDSSGNLVRKSGVMGIVVTGGEVKKGDGIEVLLPGGKQKPLEVV